MTVRISNSFPPSHYRGNRRGYVRVPNGQTPLLLGRTYTAKQRECSKKKTTRISRAGAYIKPLLVQCALAICKSDKHPEIRSRYLALKKRRGHKKAIIAICRMLLTSICDILRKSEPTTGISTDRWCLFPLTGLLPLSRQSLLFSVTAFWS